MPTSLDSAVRRCLRQQHVVYVGLGVTCLLFGFFVCLLGVFVPAPPDERMAKLAMVLFGLAMFPVGGFFVLWDVWLTRRTWAALANPDSVARIELVVLRRRNIDTRSVRLYLQRGSWVGLAVPDPATLQQLQDGLLEWIPLAPRSTRNA